MPEQRRPSADQIAVMVDDEMISEAPTARQRVVTKEFLATVPRLAIPPEELHASELDHREYFLISLLDGVTTIENLIDICGMPSEEALALLDGLVRRGILGIE
jgi:hypothetical protein